MRVTIVALEGGEEALVLRALLESLGIAVCLNRPGKPSEVFEAFGFYESLPDAVIISAHGDQDGFVFPEMAPGVDDLVLPGDRIGPDLIASRLVVRAQTVISLACETGRPAMRAAFRRAGAERLIAPSYAPFGWDVPIWSGALFHGVCRAELSWGDAVARANTLVPETSRFNESVDGRTP